MQVAKYSPIAIFATLLIGTGVVAKVSKKPDLTATSSEQLSVVGLTTMNANVDKAIAPIVSDAELRGRMLAYLSQQFKAIDKARDELLAEVRSTRGISKEMDVLYNPSTTAWVATSAR